MKFRFVPALVLGIAIVAWQGFAWAQPSCPLPRVTLQENVPINAPAGFDQVFWFDVTKNKQISSPGVLSENPKQLMVNALVLEQAKAFKAAGTPDRTQLQWGKKADAAATCLQPFDVAAPQNPVQNPAAAARPASTPVDVQLCQQQGRVLRMKIRQDRRLTNSEADDFSLVVFCRDLTALQIDRDYGVQGEPIYVALYDDGTLLNPHAEFPVCSIEQAGPRVFQSETGLPKVGGVESTVPFETKELAHRTCFDTSVEVDLKAQRADPGVPQPVDVSKSYVLGQASRYQATLHVGALFTKQQEHSFGLRADSQNVMHVFDKGPDGRGPEYAATLVIYALPRQLGTLFGGKAYSGRDILHEKRFADRLGGVLGVGLSDPSKRFVVGFAFELFDYINLAAVYSYARLPELAGVKDGDVFTGTVDQIPVKDEWKGHFEIGITLDVRYANLLFKR